MDTSNINGDSDLIGADEEANVIKVPNAALPPAPNEVTAADVKEFEQRKATLKDAAPYPARKPSFAHELAAIFLPNRTISHLTLKLLTLAEAAIALILWFSSPYMVLPRPDEVISRLPELWVNQGLGDALGVSFSLNLQAILWSSLISLGLAYLTVLPVFRPIVTAVSKGRFLSFAGITLIFTLITGGGRPLQVALLVFGITVFYVTGMAAVIAAIPKSEFDHARTLRMNEWRVVWEVVILGTADKAFEVLRQNAAMGWLMLTLVEGIVRAEGGIGNMLLAESKHFRLADVFAIQFVILMMGMAQDYTIGLLRSLLCPHADLALERK